MECTRSLLLAVSGWIPRHVIGAVLVSLPAISVLSHLFSSIPLPLQVNTFVGIKTEKVTNKIMRLIKPVIGITTDLLVLLHKATIPVN